MAARRVEHRPDRQIAALAGVQHGVVSRAQLAAAGLGRGAIAHRIEIGWLHRVHRGVYAAGHPNLTAGGHRMAAVLACGPEAVLSHRSAGAHWGLRASAAARIDVALPGRGGRRARNGIRVHRLGSLDTADVTTHDAVPVTTLARTLLDLATVASRRAVERAVEEAERLRLFDLREVEDLLDRTPGCAGRVALGAVLRELEPGSTLTRSELEELFLALCDEQLLPRPAVNARLGEYEVDFLWRAQRLAIETDGRASHATRAAFEADRARDARLTVAGYRVVRFTHRQLTRESRAIAAVLAGLLRHP